jgi:hypothetical protein
VDNQCRPLVRDPIEHLPRIASRIHDGRLGGSLSSGHCYRNHKVCIVLRSG